MRRLACLALAALLVALGGCGGGGGGGGGPETGEVAIRINFDPIVGSASAGGPEGGATVETRTIGEIEKIRLRISGPGMQEQVYDLNWDPVSQPVYQGSFWIPVGERTLRIEALGVGDTLIYAGETTVTVQAGSVTPVSIALAPPEGDVSVIGIVHEFDGPPAVEFTHVPTYGSHDDLRGVVRNVIPWDCAVAVYIYAEGDWWSKPYWNSPKTPIESDGTWICDITTGGVDETATEIRAYLVRAEYDPPSAPSVGLPPDPPTADVLAMTEAIRQP